MTTVEQERLIDEYRDSLRLVRRAHEQAKRRRDSGDEKADTDCEHLSSMERDLVWTIEYLETGHPPDYHRAIYRWTVPVDPHILRRIVRAKTLEESESRWIALDPDLDRLLSLLPAREREAFVLVRGRGISYRLTAEYMGLRSAGTVSALVKRAERRIRRAVVGYHVAHPSQ